MTFEFSGYKCYVDVTLPGVVGVKERIFLMRPTQVLQIFPCSIQFSNPDRYVCLRRNA